MKFKVGDVVSYKSKWHKGTQMNYAIITEAHKTEFRREIIFGDDFEKTFKGMTSYGSVAHGEMQLLTVKNLNIFKLCNTN